jgi:hypothetical protein
VRIFRKKETYNEQMLREAKPDGVVPNVPERAAESTPEQEEAFEKADEAVEDAGWREEKRMRSWMWFGGVGFGSWFFRPKLDPPPGGPGLRDALHEDDEKS